MIDAYVAKGPNPLKLNIFLEEVLIEHRKIWLDLTLGEHRTPEFLRISPSAKVPAIVDHAPANGGAPISIFESGAILFYLADKTGQLLPNDARGRVEVLKWVFWQVAALGPMSGQAGHFRVYAPKGNEYAQTRYVKESNRLYGVLDRQLADREYIAGTYSIADIACFPWVSLHRVPGIDVEAFPNVKRWLAHVGARPAVVRAQERVQQEAPMKKGTPEQFRKNLFDNHCAQDADAIVR